MILISFFFKLLVLYKNYYCVVFLLIKSYQAKDPFIDIIIFIKLTYSAFKTNGSYIKNSTQQKYYKYGMRAENTHFRKLKWSLKITKNYLPNLLTEC